MLAAISTLLPHDAPAADNSENNTIDQLRCEYRTDPLGIDALKPRLSWEMVSDRRGERQTAYQVMVATTPQLLAKDQGDLWDSGKVASDRQNQVEYAGKPLASRAECFWKVRVWDKDGKPFPWSKTASWSMGLLAPKDWQAKWIGNDAAYQPAPEAAADNALFNIKRLKWVQFPGGKAAGETYLRKELDLPANRKLKRAVLALYAYNECVAMVNGVNIGNAPRRALGGHRKAGRHQTSASRSERGRSGRQPQRSLRARSNRPSGSAIRIWRRRADPFGSDMEGVPDCLRRLG